MKNVYAKPIADNTYEFVFLKNYPGRLMSNSNDPPDSFHSRDIFMPHESIPGAWKFLGRLDDRVTLINGEKILPLPIEGTICQHELVREVVVFGVGRAIPGLLVFRSQTAKDLGDTYYIESIWPVVDAANRVAEGFSRIGKDMIVPMPASTPIPSTDKGSIIRAQVYNVFGKEIEEAYVRLEQRQEGTMVMDGVELEMHLLSLGQQILGPQLSSPHEDLFTLGMNSLQAIQMRGSILRDLYLGSNGSKLSQNVVFENGNIANLAKQLETIRSSQGVAKGRPIALMKDLISKFSAFEKHTPGANESCVTHTIVSYRLFLCFLTKAHHTPGPHRRNGRCRCASSLPPSRSTEDLKDLLPDPWRRPSSTTSKSFPGKKASTSHLPQASHPSLRP